jgi:predicted NAD/FAD-binding protein
LEAVLLRDYLSVGWLRVKGGVYSYIEKILERFKGDVLLNTQIANIYRDTDGVKVERSPGDIQSFNKVVFATPPDRVMSLLADPNQAEIKRFSVWKANSIEVIIHRDNSMYEGHVIKYPSEFDFFQLGNRWGYNGYLNQLCGISSPQNYFLSFQLEDTIDKDKIIHLQKHQTPFYTTEAFRYRDEVVETNGENNTYYAGAYLGDGLHEGAIASAVKVAQLIG